MSTEQQPAGSTTSRAVIDQAMAEAATLTADDRAGALRWMHEYAEIFLDFEVLADRERSGR
ncbi:type II toxin-antitoxin system VapB family antitoxin [Streptomyces sp. NPDC003042]